MLDVLLIAICAVLCGAATWEGVEEFGKSKETWLRQFLDLLGGIPSHDTFRRVFSLLDGQQFQERFIRWVESVFRISREQVVAIDGKTVRRSHNRSAGQPALQLVSAWATANGLVLGQRRVEAGSNEIGTIPLLLETLFLKGCIVTIDAIGCQKNIAEQIVPCLAPHGS